MAFVGGSYLIDEINERIGNVDDMKMVGMLLYSEKLGRNVFLSSELFTVLEEEGFFRDSSRQFLEREVGKVIDKIGQQESEGNNG